MIVVRMIRDPDGWMNAFSLSGHAGAAPAGEDLVCAAVSAIAQTIIGSLIELAGIEPNYTLAAGNISCAVPPKEALKPEQQQQVRTLMETFRIGCLQIEQSEDEAGQPYRQYLRIQDVIR